MNPNLNAAMLGVKLAERVFRVYVDKSEASKFDSYIKSFANVQVKNSSADSEGSNWSLVGPPDEIGRIAEWCRNNLK